MDGLVASDVVVRFGGLIALDHVSLEAPYGRITGLIGPNGAGKTTTFNVCCGFQTSQEGHVLLDGRDISKEGPASRARLGIGRTFQRMELFRSLTVRENVALAVESLLVADDPLTQLGLVGGGRRRRQAAQARADELIEVCGLGRVRDRLAGEISTGQGRLVELARALGRDPKLLLLDEPSSGLDGTESHAFGELLTHLVAEGGIGILMIEHDMNLVLRICDWIHVLDFGKPLTSGTPKDVQESPLVRDAYLGKAAVAG
jgi:ABC-type branched-subunit amino acid transport system ATPase component